jgi:outer membrane protein OmpA-like peptidoglycan-associated protein/opacity protein-like surface antigen
MKHASSWAVAAILAAAAGVGGAYAQETLFDRAPWSGGVGIGAIHFEGDEEVKTGPYLALRVGYDFTPRWTLEGDLNYAPQLEKRTFDDGRYEIPDDTYMLRLSADVLFHLRHMTKIMQWDPYLAAGAGFANYGEDLGDGATDPALFAGAGLMYHFDDEWAVRADYRTVIAGVDTEFNGLFSVGVNWRWGAGVPADLQLRGGALDSDLDGLLDADEPKYGTDPFDPDTDKDGLTDGQEVNQYRTDPLNPDSDWDSLKDGAEVLTYATDPLKADTDNGGVADGHEVIEDGTNPLDPKDDLMLFTLNIEFDYDKAVLRPTYFDQLDLVAKVLQRDPGATARIEGHADKRKTSKQDYNLRLSERRAKAVMDYLVQTGGIEASRLTHKGYGFDRPVAPNDTEANMQMNRRTEIYIRPSASAPGDAPAAETSTAAPMAVPGTAPAPAPAAAAAEAEAPAAAPLQP